MRILFVAIPNSVHVVRWINQVFSRGWNSIYSLLLICSLLNPSGYIQTSETLLYMMSWLLDPRDQTPASG